MPFEGRRKMVKGSELTLGLTHRIERDLELLRRHLMTLKTIMDNEPIGIIRISELTGFPQHKIRYSLRILEQAGLIEPTPQGAVTTNKIRTVLPHIKASLKRMGDICQELVAYLGEGEEKEKE